MAISRLAFVAVCVLLLGLSHGTHPHYTYECRENKNVDFIGLWPGAFVMVNQSDAAPECNFYKIYKSDKGKVTIPYNCMDHDKNGSSVVLHVHDKHSYSSASDMNTHLQTILSDTKNGFVNFINNMTAKNATICNTTADFWQTTNLTMVCTKLQTMKNPTNINIVTRTPPFLYVKYDGFGFSASSTDDTAVDQLNNLSDSLISLTREINKTCKTADKFKAAVQDLCRKVSSNAIISLPQSKPIGGKWGSEYKLFCKSIPSNGTIKTAIKHFEGSDYDILPERPIRVSGIDIRFKPDNHEQSTDLSAVYVGEEFYIFIKYRGETPYDVVPENCTAHPGRSTEKNGTIIWNSTKCSAKFHGDVLMENFNISTKLAFAKVYGFHFFDTNDITIQCTVRICEGDSCNKDIRDESCYAGATSGRRKRRTLTSHVKRNVEGTIHVYDREEDLKSEMNGATSVMKGPLCVIPAVFIVIRKMFQF